jgi:predicted nucleic acid-binding protein
MKPVFADTAYFIALLSPADHFHGIAVDLAKKTTAPIVTTYWILAEVGDAFSQPKNRSRFIRLVEILENVAGIEVLPPCKEQFQKGVNLHAERPDKDWSLTDCISFSVMVERGLSEALTTDHHFGQAGFRPLMRGDS